MSARTRFPSSALLGAGLLACLLPACAGDDAAAADPVVDTPRTDMAADSPDPTANPSPASDTPAATASGATPDAATDADAPAGASGFYALSTRSLAGEEVELATYDGQVALVVNVASACGLTPQYAGLQDLHEELSGRGFTVLAFPCNDFGQQEPGTPDEIASFCDANYGVTFPMFEKVVTRAGADQSEIYATLDAMAGALPNWNFGKYVVSRDGRRVRYFAPTTKPDDAGLLAAIEAELAEGDGEG